MSNNFEFKLSERDKKRFEAQARKIKDKDVIKVITKFGQKLEKLEKWIRQTNHVPNHSSHLCN